MYSCIAASIAASRSEDIPTDSGATGSIMETSQFLHNDQKQHLKHTICANDLIRMSSMRLERQANGKRYPLVGGTRGCHFDGTNSKPHKVLENAQTPTSRVHALLDCVAKY